MLYPLKFETIFKEKIWGGSKIHTILEKDFSPLSNCGETWEISGVKGNVSIVSNGSLKGKSLQELLSSYGAELIGKKSFDASPDEFPLLVKFIDANEDLSIQVHPNDELAKQRHDSLGKTEMWYVMQADEGAELISGFNREMDRETYQSYFESGRLMEVLNKESVKKDDVFFLPAGRVHTIGKGLMIAEIQQTSDITYRIYDFDRTDDQGNKRDLHVEEALDAIDYKFYESYKTDYSPSLNERSALAKSQYFVTNKVSLNKPFLSDYSKLDSFVIYVVLGGSGNIKFHDNQILNVQMGDCVLLPASMGKVEIVPDAQLDILESHIPE